MNDMHVRKTQLGSQSSGTDKDGSMDGSITNMNNIVLKRKESNMVMLNDQIRLLKIPTMDGVMKG